MKWTTLAAVAASIVLAGCNDGGGAKKDDRAEPVVKIANDTRIYEELSTNDVVVRVNGVDLTKGEVERQIQFRVDMAKLRNGKKVDPNMEARMRRDMERSCDQQFIMQELMRGYAVSNGLTVTEADRVPMREQLVRTYTRGGSYRKLVKSLSQESKAILGEGVDRELWVKKGREKLVEDHLKPIEEREIAARREYFTKYNERANIALAQAWADASNVWKKATGGYPFEKLVEQYADNAVEHVSSEPIWGDIKASDYKDDKGLYNILTKTPEGAIPPPFEGDNGLLVVKMLKVIPLDLERGRPEPLYQLAKIHFELPEIWEVQTDEELRADIDTIHHREAFQRGIQELVNASKIEYPCGTNLFPKAQAKRRPVIPASVRRRLPMGVKMPD